MLVFDIQGYSCSFLDKYYHTFVIVQNGALLVLWPKALRKKLSQFVDIFVTFKKLQ